MIRLIEGLPPQVVGFEAVGQVESADDEHVLDPAIEQALQTHDKLRLLYVLGEELTGYTGGAMWEDTKLGGKHWHSWEKIAVVTDEAWIGNGVKALGWMIPGEVRVFPTGSLDDAKNWVAE